MKKETLYCGHTTLNRKAEAQPAPTALREHHAWTLWKDNEIEIWSVTRCYSQTFLLLHWVCSIMHASLLKSDVQPNRENRMWRLRLLTIHFTRIVNASALFQPLIGSRVRHLQWSWRSLMKSTSYDFLTNKSIWKDRMISHRGGVFSTSNSWRHHLFPNASVRNE